MNDLKEYTSTSSPYEVIVHLTDKIVRGDLVTFKALRAYCEALPDTPRTEAIFKRAFELQKRLYWGFFREISPISYPKVWSKVVVPDQRYHFAGDIKRMAMIPDVYMAMIDIHGYTRFCQKYRHNMSMLDLLDRVMQQDLPAIASRLGVVSRRASGDEILLLGGSAAELFEAVYLISRSLAKEGRARVEALDDDEDEVDGEEEGALETEPSGVPSVNALPSFQISAGVAGGAKYAQLVITRDGDLSGTIVNTAARLQARANRIAPDRTKILLTSVTFQKLKTLPSASHFEFLRAVDFFDTGMVEFKGVNVPVFDTVFLDREANRLEYRDRMGTLYDSLGQGLWSSRVFADSLNLMARIVSSSSEGLVDDTTGQAIDATDPISVMQRIKKAQGFYQAERYEQAVAEFSELVDAFVRARGRDAIATEYLVSVRDKYRIILELFVACLDQEIDEHLETIFVNQTDRANYRTLEKHHGMYESVRDAARIKVADRRNIWTKIIESESESLKVNIQAKK
jgi:class 3 adenylate cyclase